MWNSVQNCHIVFTKPVTIACKPASKESFYNGPGRVYSISGARSKYFFLKIKLYVNFCEITDARWLVLHIELMVPSNLGWRFDQYSWICFFCLNLWYVLTLKWLSCPLLTQLRDLNIFAFSFALRWRKNRIRELSARFSRWNICSVLSLLKQKLLVNFSSSCDCCETDK